MKDVIGWLVLGTILFYLGLAGIVEPIDNRVTSVIGPYIILPLGVILYFRGALILFKAKAVKPLHIFLLLTSYPAMTLGVALIFARWLIVSFWVRLVIGLVIFVIGFLLRMAIKWSSRPPENPV